MSRPRVSIVIPVYNALETLETTVESIRRQSFGDWEAVIVDDGSTDASARLAGDLAKEDPRLRLLTQTNSGVCEARNAGLAAAKGELVLFLDSDDWIEPTFMDVMVAALDGSGADVAYCGYRRVAANGSRLPKSYSAEIARSPFSTFAHHCLVAVHCVLTPRTLLVDIGGFDPDMKTCEDWDLWQRVARTGARFVGVDQPLALYRMRAGSLSLDLTRMALDGLTVLKRGAQADPRVANPDPDHTKGAPENLAMACAYFLTWCATAAAAAGQDVATILDAFPPVFPSLSTDALFAIFREATVVGSQATESDIARAWADKSFRLLPLFTLLEKAAEPSSRGLLYTFESTLVRDDPLATPLRLNTVIGERAEINRLPSIAAAPGIVMIHLRLCVGAKLLATWELPAWGRLSASEIAYLALKQLGAAVLARRSGSGTPANKLARLFVGAARSLAKVALRLRRRPIDVPSRLWRTVTRALPNAPFDQVIGARISDVVRVLNRAGRSKATRAASSTISRSDGKHEPAAQARVEYWDKTFEREDPWAYGSEYELVKYEQTLALLDGLTVRVALEVACAEGHFTRSLGPKVGRLIATDISQRALERARRRCEGLPNIEFKLLDLVTDDLPSQVDLIVCSEMLYYLTDADQLASIARRLFEALAPGGRIASAHAFLAKDSPAQTSYDWELTFGANTIAQAFASLDGLFLERSIRTELYRIDLWREGQATPTQAELIEAKCALPELKVQRSIIWGGMVAARGELYNNVTTRDLPVLMYHRITDQCEPALARYATAPAQFEQQMRLLRRHGFYSIGSSELYGARQRDQPLRGRPVLISFDDGYLDFYDTAWPILNRNGFLAEVFVVTDLVGTTASWDEAYGSPAPLMDWDQIAELRAAGVTFGSHLAKHRIAASLTSTELLDEAVRSRRALETRLGGEIISLAAPFGNLDERGVRVVHKAGYRVGYTTRAGVANLGGHLLQLPRQEIWNGMSLAEFAQAVGL